MAVRDIVQAAAGQAGGENLYIEDVFSTYLYTGNGSTQTITNDIDLDGEGGLVWAKSRNATEWHSLCDTARGVNSQLFSNATNAASASGVTQFNSNGYATTGSQSNLGSTNYVSWTFRKAPKFFDVVTYTGTGANRTVSHNLGSVPGCIIVKRTDTTGDWQVYHRDNTASPETDYLVLNSTAATADSNTRWNDTQPTDAVFSLGTEATVNASGGTYVAYLFAHDDGGFGDDGEQNVVSCGSFTTDGTGAAGNITLGYESQWILLKRSDGTGSWNIIDVMRSSSLTFYSYLQPNASTQESSSTSAGQGIFPTATGFFVGTNFPAASATYIYIAIRRGPMKVPTLGTSVFSTNVRTGTGSAASITGIGFPPDVIFNKTTAATEDWNLFDKLRGRAKFLYPSYPTGESPACSATQDLVSFDQNGFSVGDRAYSQINFASRAGVNEIMRRAPSFLDVVCYTGTGSNTTFTHNLGAVPQLMIVKSRTASNNWDTYCSALANTQYLVLNDPAAAATGATRWNSTTPTSSVFSVGTSTTTNATADTFVAYLFATCPGVSKVGSYTGTGALQTVACGFTSGARFVMIKRTDSTGDWYVWDSVRGITSGNDPYVLMNTAGVEVTGTNYVDTDTTGFKVTAAAPAALNATGGTYIFLAIA
jgi:hypothetical protein